MKTRLLLPLGFALLSYVALVKYYIDEVDLVQTNAQRDDVGKTYSAPTSAEMLVLFLSHWHYYQVANPYLKPLFGRSLMSRPWAMFVEGGAEEALRHFGGPVEIPGPTGHLYDGRWDVVLEAFKIFVAPIIPFRNFADRKDFNSTTLIATCRAVVLSQAPWCGMEASRMSEWLADPHQGKGDVHGNREATANAAAQYVNSTPTRSMITSFDRAIISGIRWKNWPDSGLTVTHNMLREGGGSVFFRRVPLTAPVWLALRRQPPPPISRIFDSRGRIAGFHGCLVGSRRTLPEALGGIRSKILETMKVQRLHVVTNDEGYDEFLQRGDHRSEEDVMVARAALLDGYAKLISPIAGVFITMHNDTTKVFQCRACRQFFLREVCRASLVADVADGADVTLVMILRPDIYMWQPVYLEPKAGGEGWRLFVKSMNFSLISDAGFLPTTFVVPNDLWVTRSTLVMHVRATLPLDLMWLGDPFVLGGWTVVSHWLEMFSVKQGSRLKWPIDPTVGKELAGEPQSALYYRWYYRPLMAFAHDRGVVGELDLRFFDFMVTLLRAEGNDRNSTLPPLMKINYAPYQEQTIYRKFATRWNSSDGCMRYFFNAKEHNVTSYYRDSSRPYYGVIGRVKIVRVSPHLCARVRSSPGLQSCFAQYHRIHYYKKGKNIYNPCKPYCGVFPLLFSDGLCASVGNRGPKQRYLATMSSSVMTRNDTGEVMRFNLVNPNYVRGDRREAIRRQLKNRLVDLIEKDTMAKYAPHR